MEQARPRLIRNNEDENHLFVNFQGKPITRQGLWKILKEYGRRANLGISLTPQTLSLIHILTGDVTLYAQWTPLPTFSVTYSPNGGTGGTTDADITSGTQYTVKSDTDVGVTRTGYTLSLIHI